MCFPLIDLGHRAAPPLMFASMRSLIAGLALILPMILLNKHAFFNKTVWVYGLGVSLTYAVMGFGGMFLADGRVAPGLATVLANTQPLIAAVLAYFFLYERLLPRNVFGLMLAFGGMALIAAPRFMSSSNDQEFIGIAFIMLSAIGTGSGNILMKKSALSCDPLALTGVQFFLGGIFLYLLSVLFEPQAVIDWHAQFYWTLIVLAVPGTALVTVMWLYLLRRVALTKLNVFTFLTPVFGIIIGLLYFDEKYTVIELFGILLTLIGIYLTTSITRKRVSQRKV